MQRLTALFIAFVVLLSACGGGDDASTADTTAAPTTAAAPSTTEAPATTTTAATTTMATTTTEAPTTTAAPTGIVPGEDPDVDAVVVAYSIAFDSASDFETKAAYIDDPAGLEQTVADYLAVGESFGGIGVEATSVIVQGDEAEVGYDLLFGGNPTYPDLTGTAVRTDEGWKVPRAVFCSLMSSARVGCP